MPTSGTTAFNLDLSEIIEEAYEQAGLMASNGYDVRTARRSLNLLTLEWQNRQINLWTIKERTVTLNQNQASYQLPADVIDVLDVVIREGTGTNQSDITITRTSLNDYAGIPTKNSTGKPVQFYIDRQATQPTINVWPEIS